MVHIKMYNVQDIIIIIVSIIEHPKIEFKENKNYDFKKWESEWQNM